MDREIYIVCVSECTYRYFSIGVFESLEAAQGFCERTGKVESLCCEVGTPVEIYGDYVHIDAVRGGQLVMWCKRESGKWVMVGGVASKQDKQSEIPHPLYALENDEIDADHGFEDIPARSPEEVADNLLTVMACSDRRLHQERRATLVSFLCRTIEQHEALLTGR